MNVSPHQLVRYEIARALVECRSLEEAAPRIVEAVCIGLGWQCGAILASRPRAKDDAVCRHVARWISSARRSVLIGAATL
jgi:hypothetical protein